MANLLDMTTFIVDFNGAEEVNNLVGAGLSIHDEVNENREQLYRHRQNVRQQN